MFLQSDVATNNEEYSLIDLHKKLHWYCLILGLGLFGMALFLVPYLCVFIKLLPLGLDRKHSMTDNGSSF